MANLTDLPAEILQNIFSYLTPGCIEILDDKVVLTSTERPNFESCTSYDPDVDDCESGSHDDPKDSPADRSSLHRYTCNHWRNVGLHSARRPSKYYQWQLQKEKIPGVGRHRPSVYDLVGLSQQGIKSIKKKALCPCGYCQWRKVEIVSARTQFLAPLLVCKTLYLELRGTVFEKNIWAFRNMSDMQRFLAKLAP